MKPNTSSPKTNNNLLLASVFIIFFMCGLISCFNLVLMPMFKNLFSLNYKEVMLIPLAFNITFLIFSYPAGMILDKFGYKKTLNSGLWVFALGCLGIIGATQMGMYILILLSFFFLGVGFNLLMVAGNPFLMSIGDQQTASSRVTFGQAFTAVGQTLAPLIGSYFILKDGLDSQNNIKILYLVFTIILILIVSLNSRNKEPEKIKTDETVAENSLIKPWHYRQLLFGFIGIFMYIGIESSIGSVFINFLQEPHIGNMTASLAGKYFAAFWMIFTLGRFIGAPLQRRIKPNILLSVNVLINIALMVMVINLKGRLVVDALLLVGLFNSIMFPAIFTLGLQGLGKLTAKASGIMYLAVCGGAFIPFIHGAIVDSFGLQKSFIFTLICYIYILFFSISGYKPRLINSVTTKKILLPEVAVEGIEVENVLND
jgi:MFS transporter, FHS family, L-fucose permease